MSVKTDGGDAQSASSSATSDRAELPPRIVAGTRQRTYVLTPRPATSQMRASRLLAARRLADRGWRATRRWFAANTFTPNWAPQSLRTPMVGYAVAVLGQILAAILVTLLIRAFGGFAFPGALQLLAIALVALNWGAGYGDQS